MNLTDLSKTVHLANAKWWQNIDTGEPIKRNKGELLALVHSEISECEEGEFNGLFDDKLLDRPMAEVELADAFIRLLDYAAGFNHDIGNSALKFGVSEFDGLNHFLFCVQDAPRNQILNRLNLSDLIFVHTLVSKVLEAEREGADSIIVAEYLATCLIAIAAYAFQNTYDLEGAFNDKMKFNATREDHTHEARRIAGGKQF